jgi:hypothetical protein
VLLYRKLRYGYPFRRIPLNQGYYAIVDPDDYDRLRKYKWQVNKKNNTYYATRHKWLSEEKRRTTVSMHREIINVPAGMFVDHINHRGLDNRKANLRPATPADNARYALYKKKKNATSKYRGVCYSKQNKKWRTQIRVNRKKKQIGYFQNEIEAARAYDEAAKRYFKEFAILNFPEEATVYPRTSRAGSFDLC